MSRKNNHNMPSPRQGLTEERPPSPPHHPTGGMNPHASIMPKTRADGGTPTVTFPPTQRRNEPPSTIIPRTGADPGTTSIIPTLTQRTQVPTHPKEEPTPIQHDCPGQALTMGPLPSPQHSTLGGRHPRSTIKPQTRMQQQRPHARGSQIWRKNPLSCNNHVMPESRCPRQGLTEERPPSSSHHPKEERTPIPSIKPRTSRNKHVMQEGAQYGDRPLVTNNIQSSHARATTSCHAQDMG